MTLVRNLEEISAQLSSPDEEARRLSVVDLAAHPFADSRELLFLAMGDESWRVRKEAVALLASRPEAERAVDGLIALLRASDNAGARNSAVESLERLGTAAVPALCAHLDDPDNDLRKFLIDILGSIGSPTCVPLLVKALQDADPNVRVAAAENLGKIGDAGAVPELLRVLEGGDLWLKFTVLDALALIGTAIPLDSLAPLLGESLLKRAVYDCLGALGDAGCVPLLLQGMEERAKNARESAALALMRVRGRLAPEQREALVDAPLKGLKGSAAAKGVTASLQGGDPGCLEQLVRLAGLIGDEHAAPGLLAVCGEERLRGACVEAFRRIGPAAIPELLAHYPAAAASERALVALLIGELGCREGMEILLEGLGDESPELRASCVCSLAKLLPEGAAPRLAALLEDPDAKVRAVALESLRRYSACDPSATAAICSALSQSPAAPARRNAALLLADLGDHERLSLLAKDEDPSVRKAAVAAVGRMRLPRMVATLAMALYDEEAEVRLAATQSLAETGGAETLQPLLAALNDPDHWVQTAALKGLSSLGDAASLPKVRALLLDAQGPVLIAALSTLAAVGGAEELAPVEAALGHDDEEVVEAAIGILSGHGSSWVTEHRGTLLGHRHWGVRRSFARAMAALLGAAALPMLREALADEPDSLVKGEISRLIDGLC